MHLGKGRNELRRRERVHINRVDSDEGTQPPGPGDGCLGGEPRANIGIVPLKEQHARAAVPLAPINNVENVAPVFFPVRRAMAENEGPNGAFGSRYFH